MMRRIQMPVLSLVVLGISLSLVSCGTDTENTAVTLNSSTNGLLAVQSQYFDSQVQAQQYCTTDFGGACAGYSTALITQETPTLWQCGCDEPSGLSPYDTCELHGNMGTGYSCSGSCPDPTLYSCQFFTGKNGDPVCGCKTF